MTKKCQMENCPGVYALEEGFFVVGDRYEQPEPELLKELGAAVDPDHEAMVIVPKKVMIAAAFDIVREECAKNERCVCACGYQGGINESYNTVVRDDSSTD